MNNALVQPFEKLERNQKAIFDLLGAVSPAVLSRSPAPGKWSILEILSHLIISEKLTVRYMEKKFSGIETLKNSNVLHALRYFIFIAIINTNLKFKAPKVVVAQIPPPGSFEELKKEWLEVRKALKNILENLKEEDNARLIFKHPIAGRFNIKQTLGFLDTHNQHHVPQMKSILKKMG